MSDAQRTTYEGEPDAWSPWRPCVNCGEPGHEHDKERVYHKNGRYSYDYVCPEVSES
jgi:hypothetical protein